MQRILEFYANHKLDITEGAIDLLTRNILSKMNKMPIPDEVLEALHNSLVSSHPNDDLSTIFNIKKWGIYSFKDITPLISEATRNRIVSFGPLGMRLVISQGCIILPSILYEEEGWYSPQNKDVVQIIRSYYRDVIKTFSGDHALYVHQSIADNHLGTDISLHDFEQYLMTRYGAVNTKLFAFSKGKYPKYYIDTFEDI